MQWKVHKKFKEKVLSGSIQHQQNIMKGEWNVSGVTKHTKDFQGEYNWVNPKTLAIFSYI